MTRFLLLILMVLILSLLTSFVVDGTGRSQIRKNMMQRRGYQKIMSIPTSMGAFRYLQKGEVDVDRNEEKTLNHMVVTRNYQREYLNQKVITQNMKYSDEKKYINSRERNPFHQNFYSIYIKDSPVFRLSYYMQPDIYKNTASQAPTSYNGSFLFDSNSFENSSLDNREEHKIQHSIDEARSSEFSGVYLKDGILISTAEKKKILQEIIEKELAKRRNTMVQRPELQPSYGLNSSQSMSHILQKELKMAKADSAPCQKKWMVSLLDGFAGGDINFNMSKQCDSTASQNNIERHSHSLSENKTINNTGEKIIGTNFTKSDRVSTPIRRIKINKTEDLFHKSYEENKNKTVVLTEEESFQNYRNKEVIPIFGPDYKNSRANNQSYFKNSPIIYVSNFKIRNSILEKNPLWRVFVNRDRYAGNMFSSEPAVSQIQTERKNNSSLPEILKKPVNYTQNIGKTTTILTNNSKSTVGEKEETTSELYHNYNIDHIYSDYSESESNDENENASRSVTLRKKENISQLKKNELKMHEDAIYDNFHSHPTSMSKPKHINLDTSGFGKVLRPENHSSEFQLLKHSIINPYHPEKESSSNQSGMNREDTLQQLMLFQKTSIYKDMEGGKEFSQQKNSTNRNHNHADKAEKAENSQIKSYKTHGNTIAMDSSINRNYKPKDIFEGNQKHSTKNAFERSQNNKKEGSDEKTDSMDSSIHKNNISIPLKIEGVSKKPFEKSEEKSNYDMEHDITTEINERAYSENYFGDNKQDSLIFGSTLDKTQNSFLKEYNVYPVKSKKAKGKTYLYDRLNEYHGETGRERKDPEDEDREEMLRRVLKPKSLVGSPWKTPNLYLNSDLLRGNIRTKYQSKYQDSRKNKTRY